MSRIGKKPVSIPSGVEVTVNENTVSVKGPKGSLTFPHLREARVTVSENEVLVAKVGDTKVSRAVWGTTAKIISNMIAGVTTGFQKQLELNGVGYRMNVAGKKLTLALGFSHPVERMLPEDLDAKIENNVLTISGIDKQKVGEFTAVIRKLKPVEPYKGKGFRYVGEVVRRKEGKKASA
ncbi:MAG: 50S ribosomal protein L6 [Candidatus Moranbacteria bacterium]|nr:50S ribosomal protein L6 [Candidatus Moranbacteria bacterium]OIQ01563.1 MAG: 50S ribosomal protein L6 [Candidatus Moranbacteria bacterium CG2_30_41_165]PIP25773.1 MAG: 50S ribosomal protein L6 [Candidatus Moranbacteria bacterium CG23_combo_of_CG06-09_8_20_14_all_41_28]PIV86626.1 MAG: 50S ribosomal protein L6 [Candidatus Moranbacteria bacterium CG17_big_fil_post_rev_8_21_14_2_50_41_107]PIW94429.1 MAG: 50S ribosomal protein L6 [Candidatus Moranbacteria bacterium CG_4_8_14_3_um_filter_41_13]PI